MVRGASSAFSFAPAALTLPVTYPGAPPPDPRSSNAGEAEDFAFEDQVVRADNWGLGAEPSGSGRCREGTWWLHVFC
ncbi:hypothetical protein GCM10017557_32100 [Streptomyces aurantiacus]|uniref:Uncharacterized protein n=1 Tax=Streptomyces aurantiacus TaxID=47760 RepID=A0A7G1P147_9ACTN|nr:hypothetical protein GCM10017557_32100 [Streptomyces aurantiacus]